VNRRTIATFLACSLIFVVPSAHAQGMPESVLRLKPNTTLRVETMSLSRIQGQFLRATNDTLFLSVQKSETVVPLSSMHAVWQRGRATKTGAIIGGLIVGSACAFIVASGGFNPDETTDDSPVAAGVSGAVLGGLLGGLIGAAIPKWHRRYP